MEGDRLVSDVVHGMGGKGRRGGRAVGRAKGGGEGYITRVKHMGPARQNGNI
jgi:hypothetical protein